MFEITADDIAALTDEDLRTLVGRLSEAEMRRRNLPSCAVTWGGDQTATDGGVDVRVALPNETSIEGFVPKPHTGFQVKKSDMPRAAIIAEMRPKGVLRPVILELAHASGAYVIVSAHGATSDSALKRRRAAMTEALYDLPSGVAVKIDFYDRNRVATWVRDHVGVVLWLRSRIGKSIPGWRAYSSWSRVPDGADATFLADEAVLVKTAQKKDGDGLSATEGINRIRDILRQAGHAVRLVGLSGVGKTRLAEALFDPSVGVNSLDLSLAIYTDVAEGPSPQPLSLASDLVATRTPAILVIDNCPADMHRQLSEVVRSAGTTVSVLTVEYDIREDQPEGTDVFALNPSSVTLIERLVSRRFPAVSQIDARTIAESSGGNWRVALALAGTIKKNEMVAGLSDAELFRRLFQQRHEHDPDLLSIAQACSLVYSFDGETLSGNDAELPILGGLIGKTAPEVFTGIAELKRRDLLQQRGPWRAVLPHAIANRLAANALQNTPPSRLTVAFVQQGPVRLLQSFSRRLGYLHHSEEARAFVQSWLAPGGLLADVANLNELGKALFRNIAPVAPEAVLGTMENALVQADETTLRHCTHFVPLLRSLAYDADYFERAVLLLVKFAGLRRADGAESDATDTLKALFHIALSGTHAPVGLRLKVVNDLFRSAEPSSCELGVKTLQAMLETSLSSPYGFEFGARSRDYGYHPKTERDVRGWFATVLRFATPFALSDTPEAELVRTAIADEFRGLWTNSGLVDDLERVSHAIGARQFWREGWLQARQTRIHDGKHLSPEILTRLVALEEFLRPKDLVDKVRGVVLGSRGGRFDFDDLDSVEEQDYARSAARGAAETEQLGRYAIADERTFQALLPELIAGGGRVSDFGRGVALAAESPREIWRLMVAQLAAAEPSRVDLLCGFLEGLHKREVSLADALLDEALDDAAVAKWVPVLQRSTVIDEAALARLHRTLERNAAPITYFVGLAHGRTCDDIPGGEFKRLVLAIGGKPGGMPVALEILSMRLHSNRADKRAPAREVAAAGRSLLEMYQFHSREARSSSEDYELAVIIRASLAGGEGKPIARRLCRDLMAAVARYEVSAHDHDDLMSALFEVHPTEVLDELFSGGQESQRNSVRQLNHLLVLRGNPLDGVPDDVVVGWCDRDPETRYPLAAAVALVFRPLGEEAPLEWTALAHQLLQRAPYPGAVLTEIVNRLYPRSWSGSLAMKLQSRLDLLDRLDVGDLPELAAPLQEAKARLKRSIEQERRRETEEDRASSGRFE